MGVGKDMYEDLLSVPCCLNIKCMEQSSLKVQEGIPDKCEGKSGVLLTHGKDPTFCFAISTFSHMLCGGNASTQQGDVMLHKAGDYIANIQIHRSQQEVLTLKAYPVVSWKSYAFATTFKQIFSPKQDWRCSHETDKHNAPRSQGGADSVEYLSWFTLFKVDDFNCTDAGINRSACARLQSISLGSPVMTRSYPFGPDVLSTFADSVSSGIISNVSTSKALFMIDARCLPGSEGGGVYLKHMKENVHDNHQLIGFIVIPLCWKTEELIGFTVCCPINEVMSSLGHVARNLGSLTTRALQKVDTLASCQSDDSSTPMHQTSFGPDVAKIDVSGTWGSGVLVSAVSDRCCCEVAVVTCRHVIEGAINKKGKVKIHLHKIGKSFDGKVVFYSDGKSSFDLAVLTFSCSLFMMEKLCMKEVECPYELPPYKKVYATPHTSLISEFIKGSAVYVKGCGLFDADMCLGPSLSSGVISNIVYGNVAYGFNTSCIDKPHLPSNGMPVPVLIHSTCTVHKGASGGALFNHSTKKLQGVVVNHVRDESCNVSYPDVNFSIPACVFMPVVLEYTFTGKQAVLLKLNCYCKSVSEVWNLECSECCMGYPLWSKL